MIPEVAYAIETSTWSRGPRVTEYRFRVEENRLSIEGRGEITRTGWIDFEREVASDLWSVEVLFKMGVPKDLAEKLGRITRKVFVEGSRKIELTLTYSGYHVSIRAPLGEVIPLPLNYYFYLAEHADDWNGISFSAEAEEAARIAELVKERGVRTAADEIVRAMALGGLEYLGVENKLEMLRNRIDELLRELLEEGINRFSGFFVFEVDGKYVVTTHCCTEYYVVEDGEVRKNGKKVRGDELLAALPWSGYEILKERIEELKRIIP